MTHLPLVGPHLFNPTRVFRGTPDPRITSSDYVKGPLGQATLRRLSQMAPVNTVERGHRSFDVIASVRKDGSIANIFLPGKVRPAPGMLTVRLTAKANEPEKPLVEVASFVVSMSPLGPFEPPLDPQVVGMILQQLKLINVALPNRLPSVL